MFILSRGLGSMFSLGKKASFDYWQSWAEFYALLLLLVGFLFAVVIRSAWISFVVAFLAGFLAGRLIYGVRKKHKFTHYLIVIGFLFGYLVGSFGFDKRVIAFLFVVGGLLSYYLHDKGYVEKIIPFKDPTRELWSK